MRDGPHRAQGHVLGAERGSDIRARGRTTEQCPISEPGGQGRKEGKRDFPVLQMFHAHKTFRGKGTSPPRASVCSLLLATSSTPLNYLSLW